MCGAWVFIAVAAVRVQNGCRVSLKMQSSKGTLTALRGKPDGHRFCCVLSVLTENDLKSDWMR